MNSKISLSQIQKNSTRMHPYATQAQSNLATNSRTINSTKVDLAPTKVNSNTIIQRQMHMDTYDLQDYLIGNKNVKQFTNTMSNDYPTMKRNAEPVIGIAHKGILKNRTNFIAENNTAKKRNQINENIENDNEELKFLSGNTKSIEYFTRKFEKVIELHKNCQSNKPKNMPQMIGNYLFEIIGFLDSSITEDNVNCAREFSIKDDNGRMHCIFYEIDRCLSKIVRGKLIRCVGKYSLKNSTFQCVSVREANYDKEALRFRDSIVKTNLHLQSKYI